ncbi:MAG: hypothetical protein R3C44_04350 [Chloroflexota bacterium]
MSLENTHRYAEAPIGTTIPGTIFIPEATPPASRTGCGCNHALRPAPLHSHGRSWIAPSAGMQQVMAEFVTPVSWPLLTADSETVFPPE